VRRATAADAEAIERIRVRGWGAAYRHVFPAACTSTPTGGRAASGRRWFAEPRRGPPRRGRTRSCARWRTTRERAASTSSRAGRRGDARQLHALRRRDAVVRYRKRL